MIIIIFPQTLFNLPRPLRRIMWHALLEARPETQRENPANELGSAARSRLHAVRIASPVLSEMIVSEGFRKSQSPRSNGESGA